MAVGAIITGGVALTGAIIGGVRSRREREAAIEARRIAARQAESERELQSEALETQRFIIVIVAGAVIIGLLIWMFI